MATTSLDVERAVRERYGQGAIAREAELCCPVEYDSHLLEVIPDEIIERDYGCGDPSRYLRPGETVLDLGSGSGKICFIASQVVGPQGRVIGVDMSTDMLALARKYKDTVGDGIGWHNVEFRRGRIQDLRLDLDRLDAWLDTHPVRDSNELLGLEAHADLLRAEAPAIPDLSVDVVVSNCVLNLVREDDKPSVFLEIFRVLKQGGRAVISDIVSDESVPAHMKADPELWSGCISGAMTEEEFLEAFEVAGFYGVEILSRGVQPWRTVQGIEFRSLTVQAYRGKEGPCHETGKAVIYRGPWKQVIDDDDHTFRRGVRFAVCEKTFEIVMKEPYAGQFEPVLPLPETKGLGYDPAGGSSGCGTNGDCC